MKKLITFAGIMLAGITASNAQTAQTANITVTINDLKTITINSGVAPSFALTSAADYTAAASTTGLVSPTATNITVISRGGYKVKAALSGDLTNSNPTNGIGTIPGSKVGISVSGAVTQSGEAVPSVLSASTAFANGGSTISDIIKTATSGNAGGTIGTSFNVNYKLANFPQAVQLATGSFTANIIYTIEAN